MALKNEQANAPSAVPEERGRRKGGKGRRKGGKGRGKEEKVHVQRKAKGLVTLVVDCTYFSGNLPRLLCNSRCGRKETVGQAGNEMPRVEDVFCFSYGEESCCK